MFSIKVSIVANLAVLPTGPGHMRVVRANSASMLG